VRYSIYSNKSLRFRNLLLRQHLKHKHTQLSFRRNHHHQLKAMFNPRRNHGSLKLSRCSINRMSSTPPNFKFRPTHRSLVLRVLRT
jgi:hypothetical protein